MSASFGDKMNTKSSIRGISAATKDISLINPLAKTVKEAYTGIGVACATIHRIIAKTAPTMIAKTPIPTPAISCPFEAVTK